MIELRNLSLARGGRVLIANASAQIHPGQKLGLTGANGCGKSTLLSALKGELAPELGDLSRPSQWVLAHVAQETPAVQVRALDWVMGGDEHLTGLRTALSRAEDAADGMAIAHLHDELAACDGYRAEARAATLLHGLGFTAQDCERAVAEFSGGWRMRLELARALMCPSDLLLLDEPTNHLDLDAILWLEQWLASYRGTLIMVSHDRDFLDATVNNIAHIENAEFRMYRGGYSDFERIRAERLLAQQSKHLAEERAAARLRAFVERFRAKATKARQAQSRLKALERMEVTAAVRERGAARMEFPEPLHKPEQLISMSEAELGYGSTRILTGVGLEVMNGERIGLLGRNGAGKTTLMQSLAGVLPLLAGKRQEARELNLGYFAQHQIDALDLKTSPLVLMKRLDPDGREQVLRDWLGRFGFSGDTVNAGIKDYSGGEKARLAFALLVYRRPNLLLLDEPTNHLDLEMRAALADALADYQGAVVLVSHDRNLLTVSVERLVLVDSGKVSEFDGDLNDYARWSEQKRQSLVAEPKDPAREQRRDERTRAEVDSKQKQRVDRARQRELEKLEAKLAKLEASRRELEEQLADPKIYQLANRAQQDALTEKKRVLDLTISECEEQWMMLQG